MNKILHKKNRTFAFIHNILIVTKGGMEEHLQEVEKNQSNGQCWNSPKIREVQDREKRITMARFQTL